MHVHNHAPEMVQGFGSHWYAHDEWAMAARRKGYMRPGWEHLAPHLRRALRIQRKLRSLVDDRVDKTLGALRTASFVLDRKGRLHHHNQAAKSFLAGLPGGSMRSGRLCSIGANCWPSVPEALAACSAANPVRMVALLPGDQPQVISGTLMQLWPFVGRGSGAGQPPRGRHTGGNCRRSGHGPVHRSQPDQEPVLEDKHERPDRAFAADARHEILNG